MNDQTLENDRPRHGLALIAAALVFALVPALVLGLLFPSMARADEASAAEAPRYLALGDSITWGYEPGDVQLKDCFANLLAQKKGYAVENRGIVGNTAAKMKKQLATGELDESIKSAKVITITCGGNDLLGVVYNKAAALYNKQNKKAEPLTGEDVIDIMVAGPGSDSRYMSVQLAVYCAVATGKIETSPEFRSALNAFISDLNDVTARIKELNPDVKIYLSTQYNPYAHFCGTYKAIAPRLDVCASRLRDAVVANARTGGYTVADVYAAFGGRTAELCNASENPMQLDFHPSAAGHVVIADVFAEVMPDASELA
ncbi:SGNH/GDSL hydrolase family protein [Paratractidigestivibacter sp.]|uniref:SGNH/GDSL hydrolase family protein n=1 Tax=Paratractidigestivibacter sp. TaxID=2847316 RepID=UPI002ABE2B91|nr:GDSL-type esterase/lipase family protein [Paratractidigestivibacter sp.]